MDMVPVMNKPADYACQRVDDVCIAADRLLIAMEAGGRLRAGYRQSLIRARRIINQAIAIDEARIAEEDRTWRAA